MGIRGQLLRFTQQRLRPSEHTPIKGGLGVMAYGNFNLKLLVNNNLCLVSVKPFNVASLGEEHIRSVGLIVSNEGFPLSERNVRQWRQ